MVDISNGYLLINSISAFHFTFFLFLTVHLRSLPSYPCPPSHSLWWWRRRRWWADSVAACVIDICLCRKCSQATCPGDCVAQLLASPRLRRFLAQHATSICNLIVIIIPHRRHKASCAQAVRANCKLHIAFKRTCNLLPATCNIQLAI